MPVHSIKVDDLVRALEDAGVPLTALDTRDGCNLYIWTTSDGDVLYIGKAASYRRILNEEGWVRAYDPDQPDIGLMPLIHRHGARLKHFHYEPGTWDPGRFRKAMRGRNLDRETATEVIERSWSLDDIELVLIRMAVLSGATVGNATGAGMWNNYYSEPRTVLARVAVANSDKLRVNAHQPLRLEER